MNPYPTPLLNRLEALWHTWRQAVARRRPHCRPSAAGLIHRPPPPRRHPRHTAFLELP